MKRISVLLVTLFVLLSLSITAASAARATASRVTASGSFINAPNAYAYAAFVVVPTGKGSTTYGPSVPVSLSCTAPPLTNVLTKSGAALPLGSVGGSGNAQSMITISRTATSTTVQSSEDIHNLSVLGGLIAANDVHAIVTSVATPTAATSTSSSKFSGLTIFGVPVNNNPAPNTGRTLPGLGSVVLNEQNGPLNGPDTTSISVNMIDIHITTPNAFNFPVGTRIVIAHADSATQPTAVGAIAYGFYATGLSGFSLTSIGPMATAAITCRGGSSTVTANAITAPVIGSTGNESSSASGVISSSSAHAASRNSTSNVNLLSGLIHANNVIVETSASWNDIGGGTRSGSTFYDNASIAGTPLNNNPQPNTRTDLPGLGYVIQNEQFGSSNSSGASETVIGLDINITTPNNRLGLPVGTRIIVSLAFAATTSV